MNNRDRLTDEPIDNSATIALEIDDPPFTRLRFFELEANAFELNSSLSDRYPGRDFKVVGGNCNELIPLELDTLYSLNWAPTFAFIDPNGMEAEWITLKTLSQYKKRGSSKVELFILFAAPMFVRLLPVKGEQASEANILKINQMYGTEDWRNIYLARLNGRLSPSRALEEYLNLMRWRLEYILGYQWTLPIAVKNEAGSIIYYMIFATDHDAGDRIMRNIYARAAQEFPRMRAEARSLRRQFTDESQGQTSFDLNDEDLWAPVQHGERFYHHEPPHKPWFLRGEG